MRICSGSGPEAHEFTRWQRVRLMPAARCRAVNRTRPLLLAAALLGAFAAPASAAPVSEDLVISQVYGGGGNTGATYQNDVVELFNRGTAPVRLRGRSI